jgi:hypothetical protein
MPLTRSAGLAGTPLFALPTFTDPNLYLSAKCPLGVDAEGNPAFLDTMNPDHFGSRLLQPGSEIRWTATTPVMDVGTLSGFDPFHSGAMISPAVKQVLTDLQLEDLEYIPLEVRHRTSGSLLAEWWFVNVFGWRDVFDLDASSYDIEEFRSPATGFQRLEARFGHQRAVRLRSLQLHPRFTPRGLFLARFPNEKVCLRVFVAPDVAEAIRKVSPVPKACVFEEFALMGT